MKAKKSEIAKIILKTIAIAGILAVPVAGPLTIMTFSEELGLGRIEGRKLKAFTNKQFQQSFKFLEQKKFISAARTEGKTVISVTSKGIAKLLAYRLNEMTINQTKNWDRKWRLIIFDVPEKYKKARQYFRSKLRELGLIQLQKSVWIIPYECEDEINFIAQLYEIQPFVRIVVAESVDGQAALKKKFSLS